MRFDVERIYIPFVRFYTSRSTKKEETEEEETEREREKKRCARAKEKEKKNARSTRATVTHDFLPPKTDDGRAEKGELVLAYIFVFHPAGSK